MIVYHGSDVIVEVPDIEHSFRPLDFGKGFYVTTNRVRFWHKYLKRLNLSCSVRFEGI